MLKLLESLDRTGDQMSLPLSLRAHRSRFAGLVAQDTSPNEVESHFRSAIEGFTAWGSPHYLARAQGELGRWLETQSRNEEAAPLLEAAFETLTEMRAMAWLEELGLVEVRT